MKNFTNDMLPVAPDMSDVTVANAGPGSAEALAKADRLLSAPLQEIYHKVAGGERINGSEAVQLFRSNDLNGLGLIANLVRERKNGNRATYILNRYINYSNICVLSCQFCAFGARKRDPHAFEMAIDEIQKAVQESLTQGITEIHMVGGLHPTL
ncbi:MAG: hypothetical protein JO331_08090, partial [Verrucomicrobia bacterium]|nr:hypothetical protein [Verrucomicrobiota bacterium]